MFVGRTAELASLRAELRAAGGGSARRAVVEGPEGIGKTALIHHALDGEAGVRVLAVSGEESERELRLGVVRQLMDEAALLDPGTDEASGVGTRAADEADPCAAGQAVCELVARLSALGTLAVVVDDAQWVDRASLRALSYVLRHVRAGRVLVLVACRDLADPWLPDGLRRLLAGDGTLLITLGGLSAGDLAELAADPALTAARRERGTYGSPADAAREALAALRWDALQPDVRPDMGRPDMGRPDLGRADVRRTDLGRSGAGRTETGRAETGRTETGLLEERWPGVTSGARRLREHTLGNPLHARALLAVLTPAALADPGVRLTAPETYRRPFARRLHACAPATRRLVAACAVLGGGCPLHVAAAVAAGIDEPLNTLEEAVTAGLLRELPGRLIDFPEPLARAAAYDGIGAGTRARLHLAAARLADDDGAALRHRAAAAGGPDEALAEELARFAAKAAQHGLWHEAAAHLELAAGLTESPARRDELRTAVLEHVLIGGDVIRAAELAAVRNADPRPVRRYVLGRLALAAGRFDEASELLAEAWRHAEPGFAADVAEQLSWLHLVTGNRAGAASWARLSIEQPIAGPVARPYDVLALGGAPGAGAPPGSLAEAVAHLARDEAGQACAVLKRAVTAAGAAGLPHHRLLATALLSVAEHGLARWDEAVGHAEAALAEASVLGQRWLLPWLEAACVAPLAARGDHERALAHATAAGAAARRMRHAAGSTRRTSPWPCSAPPTSPPRSPAPPTSPPRSPAWATSRPRSPAWATSRPRSPAWATFPPRTPAWAILRSCTLAWVTFRSCTPAWVTFRSCGSVRVPVVWCRIRGPGASRRWSPMGGWRRRSGRCTRTSGRGRAAGGAGRPSGSGSRACSWPPGTFQRGPRRRSGRRWSWSGPACARWRRRGRCWTWAGCCAAPVGAGRRPTGSGRRARSSTGWAPARWSSAAPRSWRRAAWSRPPPSGSV
ncbi:AAA family ATPase [Nonomuraea thailandensis]